MGTVRSLNPAKGLEDFCDFLYGKEDGYVHVPTKDPESGFYDYDHFFKWPSQRQELIRHVETKSHSLEVFITPGMFKQPTSNVVDSHGSYVAWVDFDKGTPSPDELKEAGVPEPTLRVQSSEAGREHWYWRYEQFNTDIAHIQGVNKSIAYALGADTGAWDAGHSLRPVGSLNHKRDRVPVHVIRANPYEYKSSHFEKVPVPDESYNLEQFKKEHIPSPNKTIMRHGPWKDEEIDLITSGHVPVGKRSAALTKLTYTLCEHGLDNSEVYSVLSWVDKRWKKFSDRYNKEKYYVSLINYARQKVPYEGIKGVVTLAEALTVRSWKEVVNYDSPIEWLIDGLLPHRGAMYLVGPSGVGKSTLAINMCANLALGRGMPMGKGVTKWAPVEAKPLKILYLSLEMLTEEVQDFLSTLQENFTKEELKVLDQNFFVYSEAIKVKFYKNDSMRGKFIATLSQINPDIILVDSASRSIASKLTDEQEVIASLEIMEQIREKFTTAMMVIHHPRKDPPAHGYREAELDDMFGSAFIAASASSIVSLKRDKNFEESKALNVRYLKTRFSGDNQGFQIKMTDKRSFVMPTAAAIETPVKKEKDATPKSTKPASKSFFDL